MTNAPLAWTPAGESGERFIEASRSHPGWYWVLRPHQDGPGRYDPETPVACPVHVFSDGRLSSPLADLRSLDGAQLVPRDGRGVRYPSWFAGPIHPGPSTGALRVEPARGPGESHRVVGALPEVPGWYWCRTNPEAPLLHVDASGVGPIYLDRFAEEIRVWSAATLAGRPVDVGELGFSEPLVSPGGVIDASGELGRLSVELFGRIALPTPPSSSPWRARAPVVAPRLELTRGEVTLRVADLARARAFYEELGFRILATRPEEGWATLLGGDVRLRLVTGRGAALHFRVGDDARAALEASGFVAELGPEGLVVVDPDGHRIVLESEGRPV